MSESENTKNFYNESTIVARKKLGQYMTPIEIADKLASMIELSSEMKVLDPACGTGELLAACCRKNPDVEYCGWDVDGEVLVHAIDNGFTYKNVSTLEYFDEDGTFDLIVANPPFFQFSLSQDQRKYYKEIISGRTNIFSLFFHRAIDLLKENGVLAFIVPPSMNNGAFFRNLRNYLVENCVIQKIEILGKSNLFDSAQTEVQIIVLKKMKNQKSAEYVFMKNDILIFSESANMLRKYWDDSLSLEEMGYEAITGTVVWNQHKGSYCEENNNGNVLPLIYSKDIKDNKIILSGSIKNRFLPKEDFRIFKNVLVINRIVGGRGSRKFKVAKIEQDFLIENHLNVIRPIQGVEQKMTLDELYEKIVGFDTSYLDLLTGNTQISCKEMMNLIPIKYY